MSRKNLTIVQNYTFAERLIEVCGSSQTAQIARFLDVSYQAARNYLEGRLPDSIILLRLSERTPYSIHWLLTGKGEKFIEKTEKKDTSVLSDQIRELVRAEVLELVEDFLIDRKKMNQPKIFVLSPDKIKQEKVMEDSVVNSTENN